MVRLQKLLDGFLIGSSLLTGCLNFHSYDKEWLHKRNYLENRKVLGGICLYGERTSNDRRYVDDGVAKRLLEAYYWQYEFDEEGNIKSKDSFERRRKLSSWRSELFREGYGLPEYLK